MIKLSANSVSLRETIINSRRNAEFAEKILGNFSVLVFLR